VCCSVLQCVAVRCMAKAQPFDDETAFSRDTASDV